MPENIVTLRSSLSYIKEHIEPTQKIETMNDFRRLSDALTELEEYREKGGVRATPSHPTITLLAEHMTKAKGENPCGDLYRALSDHKLLSMFMQNVCELFLAYSYENDQADKIADCANYLSFLLHNLKEPPQTGVTFPERVHVRMTMSGAVLPQWDEKTRTYIGGES